MLLMSLCSEYRLWVNAVVLNILVLCSIWDIREVDVDFNRDTFFSLHITVFLVIHNIFMN